MKTAFDGSPLPEDYFTAFVGGPRHGDFDRGYAFASLGFDDEEGRTHWYLSAGDFRADGILVQVLFDAGFNPWAVTPRANVVGND